MSKNVSQKKLMKKLICIIIFKGLGTCNLPCTTKTVCTKKVSQFMQGGEH